MLPRLASALRRGVGCVLALWLKTLRVEWPQGEPPERAVFGLWHQDLPACMAAFKRRGVTVMVSASHDGDLAAAAASCLGYTVVRGSSSRRQAALRALRHALSRGSSVGMALDGPHGPALQAKPGAEWLARTSGCSLVTLTLRVGPHFRIRSWDHTIFPLPFAKVSVGFHKPDR